ncbi:MAG: hypothetical protein RL463_320, partial [Bacteroidota bacterium]
RKNRDKNNLLIAVDLSQKLDIYMFSKRINAKKIYQLSKRDIHHKQLPKEK